MHTVIFAGQKCSLGVMKPGYADSLVEFSNDLEVTRFTPGWNPPKGPTTWAGFISRMSDSHTDKIFAILVPEEKGLRFVGIIGLHQINEKHRTAEFWIVIGEKGLWGNGVGVEATDILLQYGFVHLGLRWVDGNTVGENTLSQRLQQKVGFRTVGIRPKRLWHRGKFHDETLFTISPSDWRKSKKRRSRRA